MKTAFLLLLVVAYTFAVPARVQYENDLSSFAEFRVRFNRSYSDIHEFNHRFYVFRSNLRFIEQHNYEHANGLHSFTVAVNNFADLTNEEFRAQRNGYKGVKKPSPTTFTDEDVTGLPITVDWRKEGYVTGVKDQGQCGSCWAFSTVASLEGQHFAAKNQLVSLSEQNLVDCSGAEGNQGCDGGLMDQGFEYIIDNKGIDTEKSYPYKAEDESCEFKKKSVGATMSSYTDVTSGSEKALQKATSTIGPIAVAIDASNLSFQFYFGGVYDESECSSESLDHGVTVVGYGTDGGKPYWLVKNSWGTSWGLSGYIMMSRNKNNQCGIATQASFPVV